MANILSYPIELYFENRTFDLRVARDRAKWLECMATSPTCKSMWNLHSSFGNSIIPSNLLCFEYLIQKKRANRLLRSISKGFTLRSMQCSLRTICHDLLHNHLILRHFFQQTELWKPLLSAVIAVLRLDPSARIDDSLWLMIADSIKYWMAKHFVFAFNNELSGLIGEYETMASETVKDKDSTAVTVFTLFHYPAIYYGGRCNYKSLLDDASYLCKEIINTIVENKRAVFKDSRRTIVVDRQYGQPTTPREFMTILFRRDVKIMRECGWPPCADSCQQRYASSREDMKPTFKCGGCNLIRYCCRNHQKKHWKLIHGQQCRKMSNM